MKWVNANAESAIDPDTGYPIPGAQIPPIETPCRFHLDSTKTFKNPDSTEVRQVGSIRLDANIPLPLVGQEIEIPGYFKGVVQAVYAGQLSSRIEV